MTTARVTRIIAAIDSLTDVEMEDFLNLYELRGDEPEAVFAPAPDSKPESKKTKVEAKHEDVDFTPDMSGDEQDDTKDSRPY